MSVFRPWGHIDWLLGRLNNRPWSLLACCGSEVRSIALARYFGRDRLRDVEIVAIRDPQPLNAALLNDRLRSHRSSLEECGYRSDEIRDVDLLAGLEITLDPVHQLIAKGSESIIIDITSFPKLWFFPIIKAILEDLQFMDVMVTYTSAVGYSNELSENLGPLRVLPGFFADDGRSSHDSVIVGIGFDPMGLVPLLSDQISDNIRLIFPFPPGSQGNRRNWMFVKRIEELTQREQIGPPDRVHIDMYDCPQVFDALCNMTNNGYQTAAVVNRAGFVGGHFV